jgi:hypothetical protein
VRLDAIGARHGQLDVVGAGSSSLGRNLVDEVDQWTGRFDGHEKQ